jgi:LPXTG-site transpeptidase (sortase) family protein
MLSLILSFFIFINSIGLSEQIVPMPAEQVTINGVTGYRPLVDEDNVSWYEQSAKPGQGGNILIYGHNPGVFSDLDSIELGDVIRLDYEGVSYFYLVVFKQVVSNELENGRYIEDTDYERLTIVTCQNEKRLIVIAYPY